jgi:type IV secretory pathway TraG/TraD family ATPase VirD4
MQKDRQIITIAGEKAVQCRLPDYLEDATFKGLWDPNPMFEAGPDDAPRVRRAPGR